MVVNIGQVRQRIKVKADSTLRNMRKDDLIAYIRTLEHNYNVAVSFNENQARYIESLGVLLGWIPVTERLPENDVDVLALLHTGDSVVVERCGETWKVRWNGTNLDRKPTHWMPLPEPPKEEI